MCDQSQAMRRGASANVAVLPNYYGEEAKTVSVSGIIIAPFRPFRLRTSHKVDNHFLLSACGSRSQ